MAAPSLMLLQMPPQEPHRSHHKRGWKRYMICTDEQSLKADIVAYIFELSLSLQLFNDRQGDTYAMRRTEHPNLINPNQAKRKSIELGASSATVFPNETLPCSDFDRACPIVTDPRRRSSNANEQIRSYARYILLFYKTILKILYCHAALLSIWLEGVGNPTAGFCGITRA